MPGFAGPRAPHRVSSRTPLPSPTTDASVIECCTSADASEIERAHSPKSQLGSSADGSCSAGPAQRHIPRADAIERPLRGVQMNEPDRSPIEHGSGPPCPLCGGLGDYNIIPVGHVLCPECGGGISSTKRRSGRNGRE